MGEPRPIADCRLPETAPALPANSDWQLVIMKQYIVRYALGFVVLLALPGHAAHIYQIGFINRLDAIISFAPLDHEVILRVVDKFLMQLEAQLHEKKVEAIFTDALREGRSPGSAGARRLQRGFTVGQVALAALLLVIAGLLLRSLWRLQQVDPGFDPDHVLAVQVTPPPSRYEDDARRVALYDELLEGAAAVPAVFCLKLLLESFFFF